MPCNLIGVRLEKTRDQRHPESAPDHGCSLECLLERVGETIDTSRNDVVNRRRHGHVGAAETRLTALEHDACSFLELAENLLDVQRIALAPVREEFEELFGDL